MGLLNKEDGRYLRLKVKEGPVDLGAKIFVAEISKDETSRNETGEFKRAQSHPTYSLSDHWAIAIDDDTKVSDIIVEAYRCLKLTHADFGENGDWEDVIDV